MYTFNIIYQNPKKKLKEVTQNAIYFNLDFLNNYKY